MKTTITNSMAVLALTAFTPFVAFDSPQEVEQLVEEQVEEFSFEECLRSLAGDNFMEVYPHLVPAFKASFKVSATQSFNTMGVVVSEYSEVSDAFLCFWGDDSRLCWAVDMQAVCYRPHNPGHKSIVTIRQAYIAGVMVGASVREFPSMEWDHHFNEEQYEKAVALLVEGKTVPPF